MTSEEHRPSLDTTEQIRADVTGELTKELRAAAESSEPGRLLTSTSMLLSTVEGGADRSTSTATLVRGLSTWNRPECSAGALAMATLIGDGGLVREVRRDAADRGFLLPRWLVALHRAEPVVRAVELTTVFRSVDELVVGVVISGGHCLTALVDIDNEAGFRVVDGGVSARPLDAVVSALVEGSTADLRVRDIAPADARARLAYALRDPDLDTLSGRSTPWSQVRPLLRWLVARFPDGGDAAVHRVGDGIDLDDAVDEFLASPWGRPWVRGSLPELVKAVLGDGLGNGLGDPLLWAPHHVGRLLDPDSSALDHDLLDTGRAPELLRDLIRYGHAERGLRPELTDDALAAVDRCAGRYLAAVRAWADDVA